MNDKEYYIILHSIIVGLTIMFYLKKWGELIQIRRHAIYVSVPILWSCVFMVLLLKTYQYQIGTNLSDYMIGGAIGTTACYYWIGMLLFPPTKQFDPQNQFAYFDSYEHFRKQISWIMGLALLALLIQFWIFWCVEAPSLGLFVSLGSFLSVQYNFLVLGILTLAFFSEHKGLMLSLVWVFIGILIISS
jgi:hypothetical protein